MQPDELLTIGDLVRLLKVDQRTIRQWIREGIFPPGFYLSSREHRWTVLEYQAFIDRRRREAPAPLDQRPKAKQGPE